MRRAVAATAAAATLFVAPPASAATVRVVHADARSPSLPQSCVRLTPLRRGRVEAVVRTGRLIRSVTLRAVGSSRIYGCDATGIAADGRRWCNVETALVYGDGRLADPRLGLLCRTSRGDPVATAWIVAAPRTHAVVVADGSRRDRYVVAGGLPIRIAATHGIRYRHASAAFAFAQYDARRRLLGRRRLVARVAG